MINIDADFLKDIESEKAFIRKVAKYRLGEVHLNMAGVSNELALMVAAYNEQLNNLVRLRFDSEFFNHLIIAEPLDKTHLDNKNKTGQALEKRRKLILIIRKQIVDMAGMMKGEKNGK